MKEKILECGCHKVDDRGNVYTCIEQFSKKGMQGIQTRKTDRWRRLDMAFTKRGYAQVNLHGKSIRVNRLVAEAFIPNPNNYPEVYHLDGTRDNNVVENLEWGGC